MTVLAPAGSSSAFLGNASERAFFRLELADALRSRWVAFTAAVYFVVFGGFVWFGLRESSVLGFTGMSRVVLNVSNAVVLAVPLVSLVATCQTVVRARTSGFFELFLSQPCRRSDWLTAVVASRFLVVTGPLVVVLVASLVVGAATGETTLAPLVLRTLGVVLALAWAFVGIGFWLSASAVTPERATVYALVAWLFCASLHDFALIGVLLATRLPPQAVFGIAASNPVEAARLALLSGVDPELSVLGPVGFWIANQLGPTWTFVVGVGWPTLLGTGAVGLAARKLRRADLAA